MNYGRQVLLMADHVTRPSGGMEDAQTRGGLFRAGGNGGGIFDGSMGEYFAASGLGEYITAEQSMAVPILGVGGGLGDDAADYPWRQKSDLTMVLQSRINGSLDQKGYNLIGEDGVLGPATCGAAKFLHDGGSGVLVPSTCQSFTAPTKKGTVIVGPTPDKTPPTDQPPPLTTAGMSTGQWALIGLGVVALGYGAYRLARRH